MEKGYGTQVDMWSYGVIAYILFCGFPPFYDDNNSALYRAIKAGKYDYPSPFWDDVSANAKSFVDALLVLDPSRRLTAATPRSLLGPQLLRSDGQQGRLYSLRRRRHGPPLHDVCRRAAPARAPHAVRKRLHAGHVSALGLQRRSIEGPGKALRV